MNQTDLQAWLQAKLPPELHAHPPDIHVYPDELMIVLHLPDPSQHSVADQRQAMAYIEEQREASRPLRMKLAREIQKATGRAVAWGMRVGTHELLFTTKSAPVMTRLGRMERDVLDTLVAAGVADTRSSALAYVVRAFALEHGAWLAEMREALTQIDAVRARLQHVPRAGEPGSGQQSAVSSWQLAEHTHAKNDDQQSDDGETGDRSHKT